jgi:FkbM family methyltransferase
MTFPSLLRPLKQMLREYQRLLLPSAQDREVQRWQRDGGDSAMRFDYPLNAGSVVIDAGGFKGQWASDVFARYQCQVHVFEPIPTFAEGIAKRFTKNPAIHTHAFALGASDRVEEARIGSSASSVFGSSGEVVKIRFVDVAKWLDEEKLATVDLIKINIEGGEYELLERLLETGAITRFHHIQVQFHDFVPDAAGRMQRILERLAATHAPTYQYRFVWENWVLKSL